MRIPKYGSTLTHLGGWRLRSHIGSRRNALLASTASADRRREKNEVEQFMSDYLAHRSHADRPA